MYKDMNYLFFDVTRTGYYKYMIFFLEFFVH